MSTGMPAGIWLHKFGTIIRDYFGHTPYHVGSSLFSKKWRDVDVRLILPDEEFFTRFGSNQSATTNPRLAAITLAFAALGEKMTGLPIDFQIQPQTWANEHYPDNRSALIEVRDSADNFEDEFGPYLDEQLEDPEVRKAYEDESLGEKLQRQVSPKER